MQARAGGGDGPGPRTAGDVPQTGRWRLVGEVAGRARTFLLQPGEVRVGSSQAADLRLPHPGVSRQHALLTVTDGGVAVEDRGSKNGTSVDGSPVVRAALPPGVEIGFGPVRLRLEAVDPGDAELAIRLEPPGSDPSLSSLLGEWETHSVDGEARELETPARWLPLVAAFAEPPASARASPGRGLGEVLDELGADGAAILEWGDGGGPRVLAARGEVGPAPPREAFTHRRGGAYEAMTAEARTGALVVDGADAVAVVVWGEFPGRERSEALLATLAGLAAGRRRPAAPPAGSRSAPLPFPADYVPGRSPAMTELYARLRRAADRREPVLIVGETGVGKERIARLLHDASPRARRPWVAVNCAAVPADLLEAEMFGIGEKVATGVSARPGRFREADGGTLFLDEVGEMSPPLQAKLLRALDEGEIQTVGGAARPVDVRVVAATNADLERRMDEGGFRRDLYYRLAAVVLDVPPLRERRADLPELIEHFLRRKADALGRRPLGLTARALERLTAYAWPGNARELAHEVGSLVDRAADGQAIDSGHLSPQVLAAAPEGPPVGPLALDEQVAALERQLIREALERTGGKVAAAAELLGITRFRLARKIERLGLDEDRAGRPR